MSHKNEIRMSIVVMALILLVSSVPLFSAPQTSGNVKLIASTAPEAKIEFGYNVSYPMLQGDSMLTSGNNLKIKGLLGVSPVAATLSVDAVLTPLAIMEVNAGLAVGTGWDFAFLGLDLKGITLDDNLGHTSAVSDQLGGAYLKGRVGAALQFDTGAIFENEWQSILVRTYHELNYQYYTGATNAEPWWNYELGGIRENAFSYKGEYVVGYNMPIMVNTVALMLEHSIFSVFSSANIRTDLVLGLIANVKFMDNLNLTIIPQVYLNSGIEFKRVAAMLNYSF